VKRRHSTGQHAHLTCDAPPQLEPRPQAPDPTRVHSEQPPPNNNPPPPPNHSLVCCCERLARKTHEFNPGRALFVGQLLRHGCAARVITQPPHALRTASHIESGLRPPAVKTPPTNENFPQTCKVTRRTNAESTWSGDPISNPTVPTLPRPKRVIPKQAPNSLHLAHFCQSRDHNKGHNKLSIKARHRSPCPHKAGYQATTQTDEHTTPRG